MPSDRVFPHTPVLAQEVLESLAPECGHRYIDATVGAAGHAQAILEASHPDGMLIGLDVDKNALAIARERLAPFSKRAHLFHLSYTGIAQALQNVGWDGMDGILFDLGVSSMQVDTPQRGFSFVKDGPLDMRFNENDSRSAADIINHWSEDDLADIIWEYGEEPRSRSIAHAISQSRPLETTKQLADLVLDVYHGQRGKTHPATRTFQAVRIAVNDEMNAIQKGLEQALRFLHPGGKIAVISFHSLEDRIVKNYFRRESKDCICPPEQPVCVCGHKASLTLLTKKPITAKDDEIKNNPRSRSAKLRVAQKIG